MTEPSPEIALVERLRGFRSAAVNAQVGRGARAHIAGLVDDRSFVEIGTFATSGTSVAASGEHNYGGGIIGGHARIDGRPVVVAADTDQGDRSSGKAARLYQMATQRRSPYVEIAHGDGELTIGPGNTRAGTHSASTFAAEPAFPYLLSRNREVPVVSAVLADAFGPAAFTGGLCDFLVQLDGTTFGLSQPVQAEAAAKVHTANGEVDVVAKTLDDAYAAIRRSCRICRRTRAAPCPSTITTGRPNTTTRSPRSCRPAAAAPMRSRR